MTKQGLIVELEQQLREWNSLASGGWVGVLTRIDVALAPDGESVVVKVRYRDGRTSQTIFEGEVHVNDVDDIVAVMVRELTRNAEDVFVGTHAVSEIPRLPFPTITHVRGPAPEVPWEQGWLPDVPIPSIRNEMRGRSSGLPTGRGVGLEGKEGEPIMTDTVKNLARQVADGKLDPAEAGKRIRSVISKVEPAKTIEEKRERFNEAAIETDDNSFVHVEGLHLAGKISDKDYAAIRKALDD